MGLDRPGTPLGKWGYSGEEVSQQPIEQIGLL